MVIGSLTPFGSTRTSAPISSSGPAAALVLGELRTSPWTA